MGDEFDIDVLRVVRGADVAAPAAADAAAASSDTAAGSEIVVAVVIGSELTDGREAEIAAGIAAAATVFIDDLLEGIAVVHVVTSQGVPAATDEIDLAVASAVVAWFAVLETPARSVAIDGRVILPADPEARVDGVGMVTVSFPAEQPESAEQPAPPEQPVLAEQPVPVSLAEAPPL